MSVFSFLYIVSLFISSNASTKYDYGMVIDAGSTGSRLFVYQFTDRVTNSNIPPESSPVQIATTHPKNDTGPIGDLTSQHDSDILIGTLLRFAKYTLLEDEDRWDEFPIYLKATAGMRLLSNSDRERILNYIETSFSNETINPFRFDNTYAIIASGEEEATFDWLGVNYIWNKLENNDYDERTFGALDLGGASTQIAFAPEPNSNILADFTAVRLWQQTHRLYTHSFLQYGTNAIEQRIAQLSYQEMINNSSTNITYNPCLNNGVNITYAVHELNDENIFINNTQFGNAMDNPFYCRILMRKLLVNDTKCYVNDCAFNGVYLAEIPDNMTFVAFSAFAYAVNGLHLSDNIDLGVFYYQDTIDICNMTFKELKDSKYNTSDSYDYLNTYCRLNTYIYTLLHEGYGFNETNTPIIFTNIRMVNDTKYDISWTQGSILRDSNWLPYELKYASDNSLSKKGQIWRATAITMITMLVIVLLGCMYLIYKAKKTAANNYSTMPM
eukprot:476526_1